MLDNAYTEDFDLVKMEDLSPGTSLYVEVDDKTLPCEFIKGTYTIYYYGNVAKIKL